MDSPDEPSSSTEQLGPSTERKSFQHVRFSTDGLPEHSTPTIPQRQGGARQRLTIDTELSVRGNTDNSNDNSSADNGEGQDDELQISPVKLPATPPVEPTTPRRRNRGYSLRRQLLFRSPQDQIEGQATGAENSSFHSLGTDVHIELEPIDAKAPPNSETQVKSSDGIGSVGKGKRIETPSQLLPHYSEWARRRGQSYSSRLASIYCKLRKIILQINEIPPSKAGREILLDATRMEQLVDERTGHYYVNNTIRSSRYTIWNFLPRQLIAQFSKLANFYFLCVSALQMVPSLSTTGTYTTIIPLIFFVTLSITKEGYDDYRRYKLDKVENNRTARVFHVSKSNGKEYSGQHCWTLTKWKDLHVGDIIKLERDDWVPADLLLLASEGANGIAYVETAALDGETNLKSKQALPNLSKACDTEEKLAHCRADIVVEDPNLDLYNFEGKVTINGETSPLTNNQVLYRGSILRNTPCITGIVIFSGEESKIRMNANKNPRTKAPALQSVVNKIVLVVVAFVVALAVFNSAGYQIWRSRTEKYSWHLDNSSVPFFHILAGFVIMFNTLIPLSLYVSLEIVKLAQMFLLNDIDMYHEETDTPLEARTSTINEDLGQISFIFSDKTGTLTDNSMLFRKMTIAGTAWLHDLDIQDDAEPLIKHKRRNQKKKRSRKAAAREISSSAGILVSSRDQLRLFRGHKDSRPDNLRCKSSTRDLPNWRPPAFTQRSQLQLSTRSLLRYLREHPHTFFARKARFFLLSIALCHTCLPELSEDGNITYQAASPDELALVRAASELGYAVIGRDVNTITMKTFPNGTDGVPLIERYEILDVIEFSSARKRMSIIIRLPNGKICVFCKGADSTMIQLLRLSSLANKTHEEVERQVNIRRSLEAQEVIRRNSLHRQSITGPSRNSMTLNRLQPIKDRDELDDWLRGREVDVDSSSLDTESAHSRPSGQFSGIRHSIAYGEAPRSLLDRDTSDDLVDEQLALDDSRVFARCFGHTNDFASEGLRTLLYAYRYLDEQEYAGWKKIYNEASTNLVNRQKMIERAAELLERDFELGGGTAIEDKLQKGVPEAIEKLRRAGIKMWMLTGDKRETAVNIGYSCRLIKDYSVLTYLDKEDHELEKRMAATILEINEGYIAHSVVVVDGATLEMIGSNETLTNLFFDLAIIADSVICCRASPSQKASLVKSIRKKVEKSVTLAIGDGANDIAMIQEAHVGIGITGKEGLQAARVSDYSIAQFRFLLKLLLVHGRWNYIRTCKYVLGTFWKELLFYLTQALYQRYNGYTGTSLYEPWSLSMFNTLFTSLPVIFMGVFEKDLQASTLLAIPELYQRGQQRKAFNFKVYLGWMFLASSQAIIIYFMMYVLYAQYGTLIHSDNGIYAMGVLTYSICVTLISSKIQLIEMHNKSILAALSFVASVGGWFLWNLVLSVMFPSNTLYDVRLGLILRFGRDPKWWLVYIFTVAVCLLVDIAAITIRVAIWPTDVDIFQEIEKHPELKKRLEEAASSELQQGWNKDKDKDKYKEQSSKTIPRTSSSSQKRLKGKDREESGEIEGNGVSLLKEPQNPVIDDNAGGRRSQRVSLVEPRSSLHMTSIERRSLAQHRGISDSPRESAEDISDIVAKRFGSIKK